MVSARDARRAAGPVGRRRGSPQRATGHGPRSRHRPRCPAARDPAAGRTRAGAGARAEPHDDRRGLRPAPAGGPGAQPAGQRHARRGPPARPDAGVPRPARERRIRTRSCCPRPSTAPAVGLLTPLVDDAIELTIGALPAGSIVAEAMTAAVRDDLPALLLDTGYDPFGLPALREQIAALPHAPRRARRTPTRSSSRVAPSRRSTSSAPSSADPAARS